MLGLVELSVMVGFLVQNENILERESDTRTRAAPRCLVLQKRAYRHSSILCDTVATWNVPGTSGTFHGTAKVPEGAQACLAPPPLSKATASLYYPTACATPVHYTTARKIAAT